MEYYSFGHHPAVFINKLVSVISIKEYVHAKMMSIQQGEVKKIFYYLFAIIFLLGMLTLF